jgi:hypothetical protein
MEFLYYHPTPGMPPDVLAIFADLEATAVNRTARQPTVSSLSDWQEEVLRRIVAVVCWHLDRQDNRLLSGDRLDALLNVLDALGEAAVAGDDPSIDAAVDAVHDGVDAAKLEAENAATPGAGRDQCAELDQGNLLALVQSWGDLEAVRRELRDGWTTPLQAAECVAAIAFQTPQAPEA